MDEVSKLSRGITFYFTMLKLHLMNRPFYNIIFPFLIFFTITLFFSCRTEKDVIPDEEESGIFILGTAFNKLNDSLDFSNPQILEYTFGTDFSVPPNSSLEIAYSFNIPPSENVKERFKFTLETETHSWTLPMDFSFLEISLAENAVIHYAIPIDEHFNGEFNISLTQIDEESITDIMPVVLIQSIQLINQWFGYKRDGEKYYASPFVSKQNDGSFVISANRYSFQLTAHLLPAGESAAVQADSRRFTAMPAAEKIFIPSSLISGESPVILTGDRIASFELSYSEIPSFPAPIRADPGLILNWPREIWRNSGWEIFRWDQFPSLLILDTADYKVQDRLLKRLAFFVEKAGFRGRLAHDDEIADLHGWEAHDYRAVDLARFFDTARKTNFPLLDEERMLESVLLNEGIIIQNGNDIIAGNGGIISVSWGSAIASRRIYMAHEGFHGLFFIDEDFREFIRRRWEGFDERTRFFLQTYFDFKAYDTADNFLVLKEFKGIILQLPLAQVNWYFSQRLPSLIENTEYSFALPPKDRATGSWPNLGRIFRAEAEVLSAYVDRRWNLTSGRVWTLTVN